MTAVLQVALLAVVGWMIAGVLAASLLCLMARGLKGHKPPPDHQPEFVCPDYYVPADWEMAS